MESGASVLEPPPLKTISVPQVQSALPMSTQGPKPGNKLIIGLMIAAAVLLLVGALVAQGTGLITCPSYGPDRTSCEQMIEWMAFAGIALIEASLLLFIITGWIVAVMRNDLPDGVRQGAIFATAIVIAAWLVVFFMPRASFNPFP